MSTAAVVIASIFVVPAIIFFCLARWVKVSDKCSSNDAKLYVGVGFALSLLGAAILMAGTQGIA